MKSFEDAIVDSITRQWFEPVQQTDQFGNTRYMAQPAALVAEGLLKAKEGEIVTAIIAKLDLNKLTDEVAEKFFKRVTSLDTWDGRTSAGFQERVSDKLATMMAERIMAGQKPAD